MARDNSGPKNEPQYLGVGVPADAADLTELGVYAALVGNRKALTKSAREALAGADRWPGLEVYETDTRDVWLYTGVTDGWQLWFRGWTDYVPALTNMTATLVIGRYCVIRGLVTLRVRASISAMASNPTVSLPINASDALVQHLSGSCALIPASGSDVVGIVRKSSATAVILFYSFISGAVLYANNVSSGSPIVWAGGVFDFTVHYQAG